MSTPDPSPVNSPAGGATVGHGGWPRLWRVASLAALAVVIAARVLGPVDTWDQRQPRTVSYTTDMLVNGGERWLLPIENGVYPATKPPLYNWVAAPFVALAGYSSDAAHKTPSVLAMALCWLIIVRLGRAIDPVPDGSLGWAAGLMLICCYPLFKLGYLARPDMLLTLWLLLGWVLATKLLIDERPRRRLAVAFWLCVAAAALTKGPQALWLLVYALFASRSIRGSWFAGGRFGWRWGVGIVLILFGGWVAAVWRIDREHLFHTLFFEEFFGRVTGLSNAGNTRGPIEFLERLPHMPFYYVVRFAPWSVLSVLGILKLWKRQRGGTRGWRQIAPPAQLWLHGAAIAVVTLLALFSISTGKRADYVSGALPPGALLAAWWWLRAGPTSPDHRWPWLGVSLAAIAMAVLIWLNQTGRGVGHPDRGDVYARFARLAEPLYIAEPGPIVILADTAYFVPYYMGSSETYGVGRLADLLEEGGRFWIVAREAVGASSCEEIILAQTPAGASPGVTERCRSEPFVNADNAVQWVLYDIDG